MKPVIIRSVVVLRLRVFEWASRWSEQWLCERLQDHTLDYVVV
jgi:hypothetical protein